MGAVRACHLDEYLFWMLNPNLCIAVWASHLLLPPFLDTLLRVAREAEANPRVGFHPVSIPYNNLTVAFALGMLEAVCFSFHLPFLL